MAVGHGKGQRSRERGPKTESGVSGARGEGRQGRGREGRAANGAMNAGVDGRAANGGQVQGVGLVWISIWSVRLLRR